MPVTFELCGHALADLHSNLLSETKHEKIQSLTAGACASGVLDEREDGRLGV